MPDVQPAPSDPVLRDMPMPIQTPRLIIRNVLPGDGAACNEAIAETHDQLKKWMLWAGDEPESVEVSEKNIRESFSRFIRREGCRMHAFDRRTGRFVAGTGLNIVDWRVPHFSIGYWVRSSEQGNGYATEITNALLRYAFDAVGARRVSINHADGNEASKRVIEKCGFEYEGRWRQEHLLPDGNVVDRLFYSRLERSSLAPLEVNWGEAAAGNPA